MRNEADAEEVAQEAILKAFEHLGTLRAEASFKPWLLQIARNEALMKRRKERKHLYDSIEDDSGDEQGFAPRQFADWRELPSEELERKEIRAALRRALQAIPEMYREVFFLRDMQCLTTEETADVLGISVQVVKTRLHRARLQLREELTPMFQKETRADS